MLAPSRNTTEQRSDIKAVELGNDSSLSAGRKEMITISWRGLSVNN
jgi:hypothetical protein